MPRYKPDPRKHPVKPSGEGWLFSEQQQLVCHFKPDTPSIHAQWVAVRTYMKIPGLNCSYPLLMATLWKFLLTLVLTALFAVLLLPYCWVGLWGARLVVMLLDDLFSYFGFATPGWVEMAVGLPMAIGWLATPFALLASVFISIWRRPKSFAP